MRSMKTVSILNHKGGVGKTTLTGCTAQALALTGFRVLAVDNDSQHNLSTMLGTGVCEPTIRDAYINSETEAPQQFLHAVRKTEIENLHIITSSRYLRDSDVPNDCHLQRVVDKCDPGRFYDYMLIDNAPGLDRLQESAINASDEIFVPTELKQFAVNGITEMEQILKDRFPDGPHITKIIPNYYRDTKRHNSFIAALNSLFPGRITSTAIPIDRVFDELIIEGKILFLHRLYSKGAAYYLKLIHELFNLDEEEAWERMMEKRKERISDEARERYYRQRNSEEREQQ
ncbi:MAG: AAA family ATPase [Chitinivibrionales bacterium]|nr:AAA family ATPase [Chitinivibrionales bacterium]